MKNQRVKIELAIIVIFSAILFSLFVYTGRSDVSFIEVDGLLVWSENIGKGLVPYKDFTMIYSPLFYYIVSLFFKIYNSMITARILLSVIALFGVIGIYLISKRLIKDKEDELGIFRIIPSLLYALYIIPIYNGPFPAVLANTLVIFAVYAFMEKRELWIGIFLSLAFLSKQNIGIYAFAAFGLYLLIKKRFIGILKLGISASIILFPYVTYLIYTGSYEGFIYHMFLYPFEFANLVSPVDMWSPFIHFSLSPAGLGKVLLRIFYLIPFLLYLVWLIDSIKTKNKELLLLVLVCFLNYLQLFPNKDIEHFAWGFGPSFILLGYSLSRYKHILLRAASSIIILGLIMVAFAGIRYYETDPFTNTMPIGLSKTEYIHVQPKTAELLKTIVPKISDGRIFVFNDQALFYYLTNNTPPTKTQNFFLGKYARQIEPTVISDLEKTRPRYVIMLLEQVPPDYPNLEKYIYANYGFREMVGYERVHYLIYELKPPTIYSQTSLQQTNNAVIP